jgi:hypothetical protein
MSIDETLNDTAAVFPPGAGDQSVGTPTPLTATATTSLTGPASLLLTDTLTTPGFVGTVLDNFTVQVVGTNSVTGHTTSTTLFAPPSDLSAYIGGTSSVSLNLSSSGTQGGSVTAAVLSGNNGNADVTVSLYYSYDAPPSGTPEPATMTLFGSALVGVGILGRKRLAR